MPPDSPTAKNSAKFAFERDDVFGRIADRYDLLSDIFSFGIHRLWKRRVARRIAAEEWSSLLDGATGTGDILLRLLSHELGERKVVAADVSEKMLAIAERRLSARVDGVDLCLLDAQSMPSIADDSFDAYSISLALKICDRSRVLKEAKRVLRPGGRLVVLEASNIRWAFLNRLYLIYMAICMPVLGYLATGGDSSAYKYLLQGIRSFPTAEELTAELVELGFDEVEFERLSLGIVAIHVARKPV